MLKRALPLFLAVSTLSACSAEQDSLSQAKPHWNDAVEAMIAETVESAERISAETFASWEPVVPTLPEGALLPSEAVVPMAVEWNGPIGILLEAISDLGGYEFEVVGNPPDGQGIVSITAWNEPLFGVAVRAGYLVPGRAGVALDPADGNLEPHWAS